MAKDLKIGEEGIITIEWNVRPIDYSREKEQNLIDIVAKKYDVPKEHVKIVPNFIKLSTIHIPIVSSPIQFSLSFVKYLKQSNNIILIKYKLLILDVLHTSSLI
jgi:hypothetical protein